MILSLTEMLYSLLGVADSNFPLLWESIIEIVAVIFILFLIFIPFIVIYKVVGLISEGVE